MKLRSTGVRKSYLLEKILKKLCSLRQAKVKNLLMGLCSYRLNA